jgi:hypothetical protein
VSPGYKSEMLLLELTYSVTLIEKNKKMICTVDKVQYNSSNITEMNSYIPPNIIRVIK